MIKPTKTYNKKETLVLFLHDRPSYEALDDIDPTLSTLLKKYIKAKKWTKKAFQTVQMAVDPTAPKIVFVNCGTTENVTSKAFRLLAGNVVRSLQKERQVQWLSIDSIDDWENHLAQVIEMATYKVPNQKSNDEKEPVVSHKIISKHQDLIQEGYAVGQAVNKARTFANQPANILTTTAFVAQIKTLLKGDARYDVKVITQPQMAKQKMNALLGVGQGSKYPSYLVDITYKGSTKDHIALIGKGVMFDTGGISIKPSRNMKEMKGDMGGAAAVVAAAWSAGQLNIKRKISFIVPIVENMVSADAQRPGDVVVASNGTSIEITNTDAEGRLILADALVYAAKKNVDCMLDIATLTGASIIALGPFAISVMGNNQSVIDQLLSHSLSYNERCWQLPLFDDYKDLLSSDVADILNANEGREAGTITAAKFLEQFVDNVPWAHLDIASTMSASSSKGDQVKGMTGAGTRALISFIKHYKK